MALFRSRLIIPAVAVALVAGCLRTFNVSQYPSSESLYRAGLQQLRDRKWDYAVQIFEKLTLELPARDSLLPLSHFHLGNAYSARGEPLLAAQSYSRLAESFATDSLADDAMYLAGQSYLRLWRRPVLDPQYGAEAAATFESMLGLYPDSEWRDSASRQLLVLQELFATKDYENGLHYFRRRAFDSAIIYLRDVISRYPNTARSRDALLRLAQSYEAIRYRDDKADVCKTLREKYPNDREVGQICGPPAAVRATPPAGSPAR